MKFANIISVILLYFYGASTFVGIGIYNCNCTHSQRMVLLLVQPSCQCDNSAEKCCTHNRHRHSDEHSDEEHDHDDCCSLVYQYMDIDQLMVTQHHDGQAKVLSLFFTPFSWVNGFTASIGECFAVIKNHSPPPDLLKIPLIYLQGQLRL